MTSATKSATVDCAEMLFNGLETTRVLHGKSTVECDSHGIRLSNCYSGYLLLTNR